MIKSSVRVVLACDVRRVWETVTSLQNWAWRSDLTGLEVLDEGKFVEQAPNGAKTTFSVTGEEPCRLWAFDLENDMLRGHWRGLFLEKDGGTEIVFTESVAMKKRVPGLMIWLFLKKQQGRYIKDLKKALGI